MNNKELEEFEKNLRAYTHNLKYSNWCLWTLILIDAAILVWLLFFQ